MSSSAVTPQELALFHTIDRRLFAHLVFDMNRDPSDSLRVMALFLWLEQAGRCRNLVHTLLSWPDNILHSLASEAAMCIHCIFGTGPYLYTQYDEVPIMFSLTKPPVSLRFFHENRSVIAPGVIKNVNDVFCVAFQDLLQRAAVASVAGFSPEGAMMGQEMMRPVMPTTVVYYENPTVGLSGEPVVDGSEPIDVGEALSKMGIIEEEEEEKKEVPADERTIFLTFSKGYPIAETELGEFFTRKFGEVVEDIFMQEVTPEDQPLYARLVLRSGTEVETVLARNTKVKFSINGKHVWARKYVRKNVPSSPPKPSI